MTDQTKLRPIWAERQHTFQADLFALEVETGDVRRGEDGDIQLDTNTHFTRYEPSTRQPDTEHYTGKQLFHGQRGCTVCCFIKVSYHTQTEAYYTVVCFISYDAPLQPKLAKKQVLYYTVY